MTYLHVSHVQALHTSQCLMIGPWLLTALLVVGCAGMQGPSPPVGLVEIAAGERHTCAVTTVGSIECWGLNHDGQLGDGTEEDRLTPADVKGLTSGMNAITAGWRHSCALTTAGDVQGGGVKCWGLNHDGQLGDGTKVDRKIPVDVKGLQNGVLAITSGDRHTCALTIAGAVKCWGNNHDSQLGDGTGVDKNTPVDVIRLDSGVKAIAAGERHTCALTIAGAVKCWGNNHDGQLGDGTGLDKKTPVDVVGLASGVKAITARWRQTCALTTDGGVKCWGLNHEGQLGDGTAVDKNTPVDVVGLASGVKAITAGWRHTCAMTTASTVKCWGSNHDGQLGDGTGVDRSHPVEIMGLTGVTAIAAGAEHTCALTQKSGECWGHNEDGQLGDGTTTSTLSVVKEVGP